MEDLGSKLRELRVKKKGILKNMWQENLTLHVKLFQSGKITKQHQI